MENRACRGAQHERVRLRNGVGQRQIFEFERPDREAHARLVFNDGHFALGAFVPQLAAQESRGKRRDMHRRPQLRPEMRNGADMILMRMGNDDRVEPVPNRFGSGRVRDDDFDSRGHFVAEHYAEIDHDPASGMSVKRTVHADVADSAQRDEQDFVCGGNRQARHETLPLRRWTSSRPRRVRSLSMWSITSVAPANSGARPPVATAVMGSPASCSIRCTTPSIMLT